MKEDKGHYSLPVEECLERISECTQRRKVIKAHIQEHAKIDKSWESDLMTLLCEYYSINNRYSEMIGDIILSPPSTNQLTDQEEVSVHALTYNLLSTYSKLMIVDELELKYFYRIHLFIH
tara:strand:+ start:4417 stop:4776 length:360 start_codon:yes stop_codon:yes gene_type:complete